MVTVVIAVVIVVVVVVVAVIGPVVVAQLVEENASVLEPCVLFHLESIPCVLCFFVIVDYQPVNCRHTSRRKPLLPGHPSALLQGFGSGMRECIHGHTARGRYFSPVACDFSMWMVGGIWGADIS